MSEGHAKASPSGAHGWLTCQMWMGSSKGNSYSREGTAAHSIAAKCLIEGKEAEDFIDEVIIVEGHEITFDEKMADYTQTYVDEIRALSKDQTPLVEQRISISHITGEENAEGTADAIFLPGVGSCIGVSDLKTGYRRVEAERNPQLMMYALGVLERFGMTGDYDSVMLRIHQPRLNALSEWEVSIEELNAFAKTVKPKAQAYLDPNKKEIYTPSEDACEFCARSATCPALRELIIADTGSDFEDLTQELPVIDDPIFLSKAMQKIDMIETWCKAVRGKVEANLLIGIAVPEFKLVEGKKGRRAWIDKDDAEEALKRMRLKTDEMYDKKVKSPTKIEKELKDNPLKWERLQELIIQKQGKPSVAPVSDPRPAMTIDHSADFQQIEGE